MAHFPAVISEKQLRRFNNDLDGRTKFIGFLTALPYDNAQYTITIARDAAIIAERWNSPRSVPSRAKC